MSEPIPNHGRVGGVVCWIDTWALTGALSFQVRQEGSEDPHKDLAFAKPIEHPCGPAVSMCLKILM